MKRSMSGLRVVQENTVDRRKEARVAADAPVSIAILGSKEHAPVTGRVLDLSGSSLKVVTDVEIPVGAAVRAELYDMLLLGEVARSERTADSFNVVFKITHSLGALAELERLNRALIGEARQKQAANEVLMPVSRSAS